MEPNQPQDQYPQPENTTYTSPAPTLEPETTPPPVIPPIEKKSSSRLIVIILSVLLLVTLGLLAFMFLYPKDDATENSSVITNETTEMKESDEDKASDMPATVTDATEWKTTWYDTFGYGFEHPNDAAWKTYTSPDFQPTGSQAIGGVTYTQCGLNCGLALTYRIVTEGSDDDPGKNYGKTKMQGNTYYTLSSERTVAKDGATGTRWEYSPSDDKAGKVVYYYYAKEGRVYIFEVNTNGAVTEGVNITEVGEKIMGTLRFQN